MVKKLLKHEFIALFRVVYIPAVVMIGLALILRLAVIQVSGGEGMTVFATMLILFYVLSIYATLLVCFAMSVSRFSKSFFSGEGYLTLSLPVTASQLIWAKLISAVVIMAFGIVSCLISACFFCIGWDHAVMEEIFRVFIAIWDQFALAFEAEPWLCVELVILTIVSIPSGMLVFYLVASVGQLFTVKNRKGMAVLVYLVGLFVCGILFSFLLTPFIDLMVNVSYHLGMWIMIVLQMAINVGCFFAVRYILTHKVNLTA